MKTFHARLFVLCLLCILSQGVSVFPVVSQESKPDEGSKKKVLRAGVDGVGVPVCIHCPPPDYSEKARAPKLEGSVLLCITVTPEGKATNVFLLKGLWEALHKKPINTLKPYTVNPPKTHT